MSILVSTGARPENENWADIFNTVAFFDLYRTPGSVFLTFLQEGELIGCIHFTETEPGVYKSPYRGTYGGFSFVPGVTPETIKECMDGACALLHKEHNATKVTIVTAPFCHNLHLSSWYFQLFLSSGFAVANQEINHAIVVDGTPVYEKMQRNNKKRHNKCQREGFLFGQVTDPDDFKSIYDVIWTNRESKGYHVSMSLGQVMDLYRIFPDRLCFFKTTLGTTDTAAAICIKLNSKVLYVFYWGHMPGFEQHSPVAFLASGIYGFAQRNGFELLDAGTSSLLGVPNFGLAAFKENLGFTASLKLSYSKEYK